MDFSPTSLVLLAVTFMGFCFLLYRLTVGCMMALRPRVEPEQPSCFGEYAFRHPHITAERDCRNCPFLFDCHESSPFLHA